ncbi:MAG: choice-of-anchor B family protein [Armatimonadetes bacterium]|nr:choice-of-anchor B family protein [Armatimonadota bacterium]
MSLPSLLRIGAAALSVGLSAFSLSQAGNLNVTKIKQITLSTFGSSAGNDCWGYVSPSGREYALMGLNNKVAFVEITNPASPTIVATIPHSSSTWCDIKVYGHYAYDVTETSGTGIQVIDMGQIDSGVVTLVKTIMSPGRSHNLVLNPASGYLYTVGSREGTGTTTCFSLADPANPVQVGVASLTTDYQHDANVVTYTSGPYAGHEIWFGCSEGRGVDVYDMTDKNAPVMLKRITYPSMGYCHQAWLSADRKYLYVDDELDEMNSGGTINTRSLIFNVEDIAHASYVTSFTSGLPSIDHNQYVTDGFTFQANYRSGLRIFDLAGHPEAPVQVGYYDTYPSSDDDNFSGAWSNYPFFPSGIVIVSDINTGLYILDVTEATTRNVVPGAMTFPTNARVIGSVSDLAASDSSWVTINRINPLRQTANPFVMTVTGTAYDTSPHKIRLTVQATASGKLKSTTPNITQHVRMFDWVANAYVEVDTRLVSSVENPYEITVPGDPSRYVNPTDRQVKAQMEWTTTATVGLQNTTINQFNFRITR